MLLLKDSDIKGLLTPAEYVAAVETAMCEYADRTSLAAEAIHVDADAGEFHIK